MKEQYILEKVWPQWSIVSEIGEGSFGKVFKIKREDLGGEFVSALKVIRVPKDEAERKLILMELGDENRMAAYLRAIIDEFVQEFVIQEKVKGHSNIVSYEDHAIIPDESGDGWTILIRMELLTPLMTYVADHPLNEKDVIKLGIDLCQALDTCEKHGIIHRDIKPANIFVTDMGGFKLGDFGVARTMEHTLGGMSKKGTYTYMAPEIYSGGTTYDHTVDIYSLGIMMYRFLNHMRDPFMPGDASAISRMDALMERMSGVKLPMPDDCSTALASIVCKACAFRPADRFQKASDMKAALLNPEQWYEAISTISGAGAYEMSRDPDSFLDETISNSTIGYQGRHILSSEDGWDSMERREAPSWVQNRDADRRSPSGWSGHRGNDNGVPGSRNPMNSSPGGGFHRKKGLIIGVFVVLFAVILFEGTYLIRHFGDSPTKTAEATTSQAAPAAESTSPSTDTSVETAETVNAVVEDNNTASAASDDTSAHNALEKEVNKHKDVIENGKTFEYKGHIYGIINYRDTGMYKRGKKAGGKNYDMTYDDVINYCEDPLHGHLLVIETPDENEFIYNYLLAHKTEKNSKGKREQYTTAYFGYSDYLEEGDWRWIPGFEDIEYSNFDEKKGEPKSEESGQDFARFDKVDKDGEWVSRKLWDKSYRFICEWE